MAGYYIYLISSLPMLHFGTEPPFSVEDFLHRCANLIPDNDLQLLESCTDIDICCYGGSSPALKRWCDFNIALNNELVKIRASRLHADPFKYLRPVSYINYELAHIAVVAHRNPSLIEGERVLDQARWNFLEEISFGHYFDLECLFIYIQKLKILERQSRINNADRGVLLGTVLTKA